MNGLFSYRIRLSYRYSITYVHAGVWLSGCPYKAGTTSEPLLNEYAWAMSIWFAVATALWVVTIEEMFTEKLKVDAESSYSSLPRNFAKGLELLPPVQLDPSNDSNFEYNLK